MKRYLQGAFLLVFSLVFNFSCRKSVVDQSGYIVGTVRSDAGSSTCVVDAEVPTRMDTILRPTILGYHLINTPYSPRTCSRPIGISIM
jgi:hypothetical protein